MASGIRRMGGSTSTFTRKSAAKSAFSSAVGAAVLLIGFGWLHVPAALLITLLLIISRMGGPVGPPRRGGWGPGWGPPGPGPWFGEAKFRHGPRVKRGDVGWPRDHWPETTMP